MSERLRTIGATLVLLVGVPLATFLVAGYPAYRKAVAVAGQTPSREAVDGLFIGAAVMASFAYERMRTRPFCSSRRDPTPCLG